MSPLGTDPGVPPSVAFRQRRPAAFQFLYAVGRRQFFRHRAAQFPKMAIISVLSTK
jgi:hypothetical protein